MGLNKLNILQRTLAEYKYVMQQTWTYEQVGQHWDSITDYDEINKKAHSYFRRFVNGFGLCSIPDKAYILDICSRTGNGTAYFYIKGKVRRAMCADVSHKMQDICQVNLQKYGIDYKTVLFKSLPLPFQNNEFEAILCFETIEHMPEPEKFMKELARVLKFNGELLLTTPNILWGPGHWLIAVFNLHHGEGPRRFLSRRFILQIAREAGFLLEKEKTTVLIPSGPKFLNRFSKFLERVLPECLSRLLALRRIFVFRRSTGAIQSETALC